MLYLALDRPRQAARSLRRMIQEGDRAVLNLRVKIWRGPLPFNPLAGTALLAEFIATICPSCDTVIVDSVKDLAPGVAKDDVGAGLNSAWQEIIAREIQLFLLHHERKAEQGGKRHHSLDDVYGSTWLTSGLGSVIALNGDPGDPTVMLKHLKQPAEPVGPLTIRHDHTTGTTSLFAAGTDVVAWLAANPDGLTAGALALAIIGRDTDADKQKIRRELNKLAHGEEGALVAKLPKDHVTDPDRWIATPQGVFARGFSS